MKHTIVDNNVSISSIIFGLWRLDSWNWSKEELLARIEACIAQGITTFDHADIYGGYTNEARFGEALALKPQLRDQIQLISKCGIKIAHPNRPDQSAHCYDTSKTHILKSVEQSLANLQTSYLDVLLIHRLDYLMDYREVAETMIELRNSGKVKAFGVSNFLPAQTEALQSFLPFPLVMNQIEINPLQLEHFYNGNLEYAQRANMLTLVWSPLAGGNLFQEKHTSILKALEEVRQAVHVKSIDQVVYAWLATHPSKLYPVVGSSRWQRMEEALQGSQITLTPEQWYHIFVAAQGHDIP